MNPFEVLLPELWKLIRVHLTTQWSARYRVHLQRTCKEAHRLDPGLIVAHGWRKLLEEIEREAPTPRIKWQRWDTAILMLETFAKSNVWQSTAYREPTAVTTTTHGKDRWYLHMYWNLVAGCSVHLFFEREAEYAWQLDVEVVKIKGDDTKDTVTLMHKTLPELLAAAPFLGLGVEPILMRHWAAHRVLRSLVTPFSHGSL
jgi:hypothetical protein